MTGVRVILNVSELTSWAAQTGRDIGPALQRFNQRIAALVERAAIKNLSGGGAPGSYPVPVPTGTLRGSVGSISDQASATIFATAEYAGSVHIGYQAYGNPHAKIIPARPYLADGIEAVDIEGELEDTLTRVFA
jgi:phage gpG-like protein